MTKQFAITVCLMAVWILLGLYELISEEVLLVGLFNLWIGVLLGLWECKDSQNTRKVKG